MSNYVLPIMVTSGSLAKNMNVEDFFQMYIESLTDENNTPKTAEEVYSRRNAIYNIFKRQAESIFSKILIAGGVEFCIAMQNISDVPDVLPYIRGPFGANPWIKDLDFYNIDKDFPYCHLFNLQVFSVVCATESQINDIVHDLTMYYYDRLFSCLYNGLLCNTQIISLKTMKLVLDIMSNEISEISVKMMKETKSALLCLNQAKDALMVFCCPEFGENICNLQNYNISLEAPLAYQKDLVRPMIKAE